MAMMIEFAIGRLMAMMMGNPVCRRFLASQRGVAAIEFAMIMPVLLILFLSSFDVGNAIIVYLKVRTATYELAAITNQYGTGSTAQISTSTMSAITSATSQVMAPYSSSSTAVTISQIKATSATAATVSWSYTVNGTALSGTYTGLPANMAKNSCTNPHPLTLLFYLVLGVIHLHAVVWSLYDRSADAFRYAVGDAARQYLRAIQRYTVELLGRGH